MYSKDMSDEYDFKMTKIVTSNGECQKSSGKRRRRLKKKKKEM